MTLIIKAIDTNGTQRTCGPRCYNAKSKTCTCICGGLNHGVGEANAVQNIPALQLEALAEIKLAFPDVQFIAFPVAK